MPVCQRCELSRPHVTEIRLVSRGTPYSRDICDSCREDFMRCDGCGFHIGRYNNRAALAEEGVTLCGSCAQANLMCECCHRYTIDNASPVDGFVVCSICVRRYYGYCADCGAFHATGNYSNLEQQSICDTCATTRYRICRSCGHISAREDGNTTAFLPQMCEECIEHETAFAEPRPFEPTTNSYMEIQSERKFGVELEFSRRTFAAEVCSMTGWGGCEDGTSGVEQEHYSAPMFGDAGLASVREFCALANERRYEVDESCGYHLHLDMSKERPLAMSRIALAYEVFSSVWLSFVPEERRHNNFCVQKRHGEPQMLSTAKRDEYYKPENGHGQRGNRYFAFNWEAYKRHKTLEIRLHTGSVNAEKICNWIKAHTRFCDSAKKISISQWLSMFVAMTDFEKWEFFKTMIDRETDDTPLSDYYRRRAYTFGTRYERRSPPERPWTEHSRVEWFYEGLGNRRRYLSQPNPEHTFTWNRSVMDYAVFRELFSGTSADWVVGSNSNS